MLDAALKLSLAFLLAASAAGPAAPGVGSSEGAGSTVRAEGHDVPSLVGTVWDVVAEFDRGGTERSVYTFRPGGEISATRDRAGTEIGSWKQTSDSLSIRSEAGWREEGTIAGDRIEGRGWEPSGKHWHFVATRRIR